MVLFSLQQPRAFGEDDATIFIVLFGPFGTGLFLDDDGSIAITIHDAVVVVVVVVVVRRTRPGGVMIIDEMDGEIIVDHHPQWRRRRFGTSSRQTANDCVAVTVAQHAIRPAEIATAPVQL
jgi:hypothetical protein